MIFQAEFASLGVASLVFVITRRYFILNSGESKTGIKFCPGFNLFTGSDNIIFCNEKVLAINAHDRHQELGDTFGCFFGQYMQVFTRDPDLIYKVCVTDFQKHRNRYQFNSLSHYMQASLLEARDNDWQTSRRAIGSVLKASKLKLDNVYTDIDAACQMVTESIDRKLKDPETKGLVDVYQVLKNFVMHAILKIIFDTDNMVDFDSTNEVVEEMYKFVSVNYEYVARVCFLMPIFAHVVRPLLHLFDHGRFLGKLSQKLEKILVNTLNNEKEQPKGERSKNTTIHSLINSYQRGELTRDQLMGNAVFLLLAGFATSIDSMSALLWHIGNDQRVQDKLRSELLQYGEDSPYLDQCINETLRLYPGSLTNRDMGEHVFHGDMRLVKGLNMNLSIYSLHRHTKYWGDDAEIWKPERFEPANVENFHPAQFVPFGLGPRNCVGYNLAKLEIRKFVTRLLLKYKMEFCDRTPRKIEFMALGALPYALPVQGPIYLKLSHANK